MAQAKTVLSTVCKMLDNMKWNYKVHDEELRISLGVNGDDLPMDIHILVRQKQEVVTLLSFMPYRIPEDKRVEIAMAICYINNRLINGCFDMDLANGSVSFRMVSSYRESILSEDLFHYMLNVSVATVDEYNDKLLMISKGMMTLEQLAKDEEK